MKVITKTVIDMKSLETLEEWSFEYGGSLVSWCGGSGGGGGGSGAVSYPDYMENVHANWLSGALTLSGKKDIISTYEWTLSTAENNITEYYLTNVGGGDPGISEPINIYEDGDKLGTGTLGDLGYGYWAYGDNDSLGFTTIYVRLLDSSDPDSKGNAYLLAEYSGADPEVSQNQSVTGLMKTAHGNSPYASLNAYDPETEITNMKAVVSDYEAYINKLDSLDSVDVKTANFDAGMRENNAVNTSNFVFGRQFIASRILEIKLDAKKRLADLKVEVGRMEITARTEQNNANRKIDVKDELWELNTFKLAGNVMAGIGGGTATMQAEEKPTETQSALAGGLSGAATGAAIGTDMAKGTSWEGSGGAYGAAAGAAMGIGSALLSS